LVRELVRDGTVVLRNILVCIPTSVDFPCVCFHVTLTDRKLLIFIQARKSIRSQRRTWCTSDPDLSKLIGSNFGHGASTCNSYVGRRAFGA